MKTIYVDMDGVLTDFERRYTARYGMSPKDVRDQKNGSYSKHWHDFVDTDQFATLDQFKGAIKLVNYLNGLSKVDIKILTSSGGNDKHNQVAAQKLRWVNENLTVQWPVIVVPGRRFKSLFAAPTNFLIDDTEDVVTAFKKAGGHSVIHADVDYTIYILEEFLSG